MKAFAITGIVVLLAITSSVMAQQDEKMDYRKDFRIGLKAGLNYSNVYDKQGNDFSTETTFGFAGGAFASIPFNKYLGLQPEALISQKGFEGTGRILGSRYKLSRTTTYLDIPIQLAFKPSEFVTIMAGPQVSFLLNQEDEFESSAVSYSQEQKFENDDIRKNLLGFVTGIDIHIKRTVIATRIGWDLQQNHGDGSSSTPHYKNVWLQATVGYSIIN